MKSLHQDEDIRIKFIEFRSEFYKEPRKKTPVPGNDFVDSHIYSIPVKNRQRPASISCPVDSSSRPSHHPVYENTVLEGVSGQVFPDKENFNDDLNVCDDFFDNIMKNTYVKLNTNDLENQRSAMPALPTRRESFHRAKLAIVQSSPVRRSNSVPRKSTFSQPSTLSSLISDHQEPQQTISTPNKKQRPQTIQQTPGKTPNLMKTLSKFHKIY